MGEDEPNLTSIFFQMGLVQPPNSFSFLLSHTSFLGVVTVGGVSNAPKSSRKSKKVSIDELEEALTTNKLHGVVFSWGAEGMGDFGWKQRNLEPQTTIYKWMFGETTIFYIKIWNHPIETTIYKWLFRAPGIFWDVSISRHAGSCAQHEPLFIHTSAGLQIQHLPDTFLFWFTIRKTDDIFSRWLPSDS